MRGARALNTFDALAETIERELLPALAGPAKTGLSAAAWRELVAKLPLHDSLQHSQDPELRALLDADPSAATDISAQRLAGFRAALEREVPRLREEARDVAARFGQSLGIYAPDPYTVRVRYDKPYARAVETWGTYMLPKHLLQSFAEAGTLRESPQNSRPVGTGPYRFQEWKPGEKVVLTANPDFYEGRPYLSRIVYRVIPSQATIFLELKAQGVDYVSTLTGMQY